MTDDHIAYRTVSLHCAQKKIRLPPVFFGKLFLHGFCLVAQMSMRTRMTFPLTE